MCCNWWCGWRMIWRMMWGMNNALFGLLHEYLVSTLTNSAFFYQIWYLPLSYSPLKVMHMLHLLLNDATFIHHAARGYKKCTVNYSTQQQLLSYTWNVLAHTDRLMVSIQTKEHVHVIPFTANSCSSHQPAFNKTGTNTLLLDSNNTRTIPSSNL